MTDTHPIIEKMAREICCPGGCDREAFGLPCASYRVKSVARAALTAALDHMMEPSEGVISAGLVAHWPDLDPYPLPTNGDRMRDSLQAMLTQFRKDELGD